MLSGGLSIRSIQLDNIGRWGQSSANAYLAGFPCFRGKVRDLPTLGSRWPKVPAFFRNSIGYEQNSLAARAGKICGRMGNLVVPYREHAGFLESVKGASVGKLTPPAARSRIN
jgi:hypothetical protein